MFPLTGLLMTVLAKSEEGGHHLWYGYRPFIILVEQPLTDKLLAAPGAEMIFGRFSFSFSAIAQDLVILALFPSIYSDPNYKGIILQCRYLREYAF